MGKASYTFSCLLSKVEEYLRWNFARGYYNILFVEHDLKSKILTVLEFIYLKVGKYYLQLNIAMFEK